MVKFNDGRIVRREDGTIDRSDDAILVLKNEAAIDAMVDFLKDIRNYMKSTNDVTRKYFSKTITGVESKRAIDPASKELISLLTKLKTSDKLDKGEYRAIHKDIRYLNTQFSHLAQRIKKMDPGREQILPYAKSKYKEFIGLQGGQLLERNFKFDEKRLASLTETTTSTPTVIPIFENIMESIGHSVNSLNEGIDQYMKVLAQISDRIGYKLPQNTIGNYQDAVNSRLSANTLMGGMQYNINWNKLTGLASPIEYEDISNYLEEIKEKVIDSLNEITKYASNIFNGLNRATAGTGPLNAPFSFGKDVVGRANSLGEAYESFKKLPALFKNIKSMTKVAGAISKVVTLVLGAVLAIVARMFKASPILQAIADLFDLAMNLFFLPLGNALGEAFLPLVTSLVEFMIRWNQIFTDFSLESLGELILAGFSFQLERLNVYWNMITSALFAIPSAVINAFIGGASDFFRSVGLDGVADVLDSYLNIYNSIIDWIKNIPDKIKEFVQDLPNKIGTFINDLPNKIGSIITTFFGAAGNFLASFWPGLTNVLGNVIGGIGGGISDTIGGIGGGISDFFSSFHFGATGGIVTSAQPWIVGEAGPEAIIPLDEAGLFGSTYYITISGDVYGVSDLESRIEKAIQRTANKAYYR